MADDVFSSTSSPWMAYRSTSVARDVRADAGQTQLACSDYRQVLAIAEQIRAAGHLSQLDQEHALRLVRERMAAHCP